jgi:methyl acetate hydrolase
MSRVHAQFLLDAARKSKIDALLERAVEAGDVPGVIAMATDRSGVVYEGAYGKRVLGQPAAMTADTVVWIASMSKALTSAGAMQLVEQGKLDLDVPAAKVVPEIASIEVLEGFDAAGQPHTRPPKRPITLRHLLTHTAGFGYDTFSADLTKYQATSNIPGIISCQNAALRTPLLFDPGDRWFYGINIDWTGKMVEAVSGKRLGAYLQDNLFAPQYCLQDHTGDARASCQDPPARRKRRVDATNGSGNPARAGSCDQVRLVCSAGDRPARAKVRSPVVRMAG